MRCLFILLVGLLATALADNSCKQLGERCDRTVFNRCCGGLYCVLKGFADGTCQTCLPQGHFCFSDAECCSRALLELCIKIQELVIAKSRDSSFSCQLLPLTDCRREGEDCSRTLFSRCCDPLFCQLTSFARGKCVKCLAGRQFCMSDRECCSGKCHWYRICSDF
ncbi:unnamed protein product [Taenia asiatica]|uniref:UPF0506 domain-containing protein n=1 Tax=Taenia asiatica TaxID=60517 RepID=A0A0R3WAF6_TAEAS|nr:unnamed protein product [Taenia asiatica]